ncbi:MAG: PAS domain-containing protein [Planctomycetes bacterium]|nr:PAS domain-containing protein [Planctomycetota bacterium]
MTPSGRPKKAWWPSSMLLRGESVVASTGLVLAAILLAVMGGTAYWTFRVHRNAMEAARADEIHSLGTILTETATSLLSSNELSVTRRLLADAARTFDLDRCRIILGDGQVIADAEPSRITLTELPATWSGSAVAESSAQTPDGLLSLIYPLTVPGRGHGQLDLTASVRNDISYFWEAQTGVGIIGALALVALLLVYRRMRARLGTMGLIREALLAHQAGGAEAASLVIQGTRRAEAEAWNKLVTEKEHLQEQVMSRRVEGILHSRVQSGSELGNALEEMWYGFVLVDRNLNITYANGAAAAFLDTSPDEIRGAGFREIAPDEHVVELLSEVASATAGNRVSVEVDTRGDGDGGGAVLRFTMRPLRREDPSAAVIVIEDVTQQRVADESRNTFVTQVAHELRTPLTNIRLCAETAIEEGHTDPETRAQCLNVINQETRRLERVVNDMLSVAEIEAGTIELRKDDVRLEALFEEMQAECSAQAKEKGTALEFNLPPKLPVIKGDRDKLTLALHNILNNAIKYTPQGGRITVNVDVENDEVTVDIVDNGIGISEEDMVRIFARFGRANDPRVAEITGSGLGLSLAREIVRLHGGEIRVESQLDKGSTFSVRLPVHAEAA